MIAEPGKEHVLSTGIIPFDKFQWVSVMYVNNSWELLMSQCFFFYSQLQNLKIREYASWKRSLKNSVSYKPIALHEGLANIQVIYN